MNIETMTEEEAVKLLEEMQKKFGWKGVMYHRGDVEDAVHDHNNDEDEDTELTVEEVMGTNYWKYSMDDALSSEGWDCLREALWEAKQEKRKAQ